MSDPRLVDMEPGGESTQYESIREFTVPPEKQTGQLGGGQAHTESEIDTSVGPTEDGTDNGNEDKMAQKLGMGTVDNESGEDRKSDTQDDAAAAKTRRQQGYGPGSEVGA